MRRITVLEPTVRIRYLRAEEIFDDRNRRCRWIGQRLLSRREQYERGHGNERVCKAHKSLHYELSVGADFHANGTAPTKACDRGGSRGSRATMRRPGRRSTSLVDRYLAE